MSKKRPSIMISGDITTMINYTHQIPDECLALIFRFLSSSDRMRCSLVTRRWLLVEGQSRRRLTLNAQSELLPFIPSIFTRFDSLTKLVLRCDQRSVSINDDGLILISFRCPNLTRLKLRGCREITDLGIALLAKKCRSLKKFSCGSCMFGAKGINALLENCSTLEELSVRRLRSMNDVKVAEPVSPGAAASSLKTICLEELFIGQLFGPLISGSKNLKTLKLMRCLGDWDRWLEMIGASNNCLSEVHLERVNVSDIGLSALSNSPNLKILHIKTPKCTNAGLIVVAEYCKYLRKLYIDGWRTNRIGDEGLIAIAKQCVNLQELILVGVNPSSVSLEAIATNCQKLERLALCGSETIADAEISCIASKCVALKNVCIKGCPVSNEGIEAFAWGCPNLEKIKVKKCKNVTSEVGDKLKARRESLVIKLDVCAVEAKAVDAIVVGLPPAVAEPEPLFISSGSSDDDDPTSNFSTRFGLLVGRVFMPYPFRRWSNGNAS